MDADEREICDFLKSFPGQFISGREVARRAGGKWKFHDDPNWAVPVLIRLKEQNLVEVNASGQYRLTGHEKKEKKKKWIAPHIQKILDESGKDFSEATGEGGEAGPGEQQPTPEAKPSGGAPPPSTS
jgi:hypothetical protein